MWIYLIISAATISMIAKKYKNDVITTGINIWQASKFLYNVIRRDGLRACLLWPKQIISRQLSKKLIEIHHKYYIIHYPYGLSWYKILVPRQRMPVLIDEILDSEGNNVKHNVVEFMGPSHNFHGLTPTPNDIGYSGLKFTFVNGETKTFEKNQPIIF